MVPVPRIKSQPVVERVARRDYIPAGEKLSKAEATYDFRADPVGIRPQYIPGDDGAPTQAVGDPEKQLQAAARAVKKQTRLAAQEEASGKAQVDRINRLAGLNVGDTIALFESASPHEREQWLEAERASRKRKGVLGYFGAS